MSAPLPFPRRINVELTNHCNQRCRLCPRQGLTRPLGFMEAELFERIARECAGQPTRLWLHFLGEPLLHRDVVSFVRQAKQLGVREVGLSTNAVALGTWTDALLDSGLDRLECSLDAGERDGYLGMRGRDHFDRVVGNVRHFLARKRQLGRVSPRTSLQFMRTAELSAALPRLVEDWRPWLGPDDFLMTIEPAAFRGAVDVPVREPASVGAARPPCRWLFESLMILQDGSVTMCGADWDAGAPIGHLATATITSLWQGAELERRRQAHREGDFAAVTPCAACEDWRLAEGGSYVNVSDSRADAASAME